MVVLFFLRPECAGPRPIIVCYGDSITSGYGIQYGAPYPERLQRKLDQLGYHYLVKNEGTNGATTKDAVNGLPAILRMHPAIVVVDFGGNDVFNHFTIDQTRQNLETVLTSLDAAHVKVVLAGMAIPADSGAEHIRAFAKVYSDLAAEHNAAYVPDIYKDLVPVHGSIQEDGVHPTGKGAEILADTILTAIKPLLYTQPAPTQPQ
jgi:acyl-CoA thioesterase-1